MHCPAAMHLDLFTVIRMRFCFQLDSPRERKFVNAVYEHVVAETKLLERHREPGRRADRATIGSG